MTLPSLPRRIGLPLAMQMIAILVCALLAAQAVTLALTVLLPPEPAARWNMDEVAAALTHGEEPERLERKVMAGPPDVSGQGWLVSESSRTALANRLHRKPGDVVLAFYTQLPVGGVTVPGARSPLVVEARGTAGLGSLLVEQAQAQAIPGGPPPGGSPGTGGLPGGGFPGGRMPGAGMPGGGGFPGGSMPRTPTQPGTATSRPGMPQGSIGGQNAGPSGGQRNPGGPIQGPGAMRQMPGGIGPMSAPVTGIAPNLPVIVTPAPIDLPRTPSLPQPAASAEASTRAPVATPSAPAPALADTPSAQPGEPAAQPPRIADAGEPAAGRSTAVDAPQPIPFRRVQGSLFDMASPPFIEGDFVAATRQADGTWLAVAPRAEPFPNAWQKRVMLWFALSLAVVSPLAWLFARRIVVPLRDFAQAAEQLGRDPSATILPLSGPAEIGRAANAFNQMRNRLRAFVDDRTAMVGAISHDLRTPLTRLRFRIEDVPDEQREGLLREVTEMEAMISQVIAFIRDASTPGPRERVDFAELIAGSVADARLVGGKVEIERNAHIPVDVDPVGIRRLLGNLLENAVKYGESARVRVSLADGEAVAEIVDAGPGIPEDEFDRAFEPFYRSEAARKSGRTGSGLGLAVCRSIARAHGGDVSFTHGGDGFVARVTVPAAFDPTLRKAA